MRWHESCSTPSNNNNNKAFKIEHLQASVPRLASLSACIEADGSRHQKWHRRLRAICFRSEELVEGSSDEVMEQQKQQAGAQPQSSALVHAFVSAAT